MARLKHNQRVVKSVPDRAGNVYSKTAGGAGQRTKAAVRYMDKHEENQLYAPDQRGEVKEVNRYEAEERVDNTSSKYQQHVVFTTELKSGEAYVDEREYAQQVADSVRGVRPDADIYAVSVHTDKEGEGHIHAHVTFGTDTTIRREELNQFREEAYQHERHIREHGQDREHSPEVRDWMRERSEQERAQQEAARQLRGRQQDELDHGR